MGQRIVTNPIAGLGVPGGGDLVVGHVQARWDQFLKGAVGTVLRATATTLEWDDLAGFLSDLLGSNIIINTTTGVITKGGVIQTMVLVVLDDAAAGTGKSIRIPAPVAGTIQAVRSTCRVAPTSTYTFDINKGGTTIYTTQGNRPTRTAAAGTGLVTHTAPDVLTFSQGDLFEIDVDIAGAAIVDAAFFVDFLRAS